MSAIDNMKEEYSDEIIALKLLMNDTCIGCKCKMQSCMLTCSILAHKVYKSGYRRLKQKEE